MGRNSGFLGGLISVFFLSIIIFFVIYFFMPDVSVKFFGFSREQAYESIKGRAEETVPELHPAVEENIKSDSEAKDEIEHFLYSEEDGKVILDEIRSVAKRANIDWNSNEVQNIFREAASFIKKGAGSASDFFTEGKGKSMIEGLSK